MMYTGKTKSVGDILLSITIFVLQVDMRYRSIRDDEININIQVTAFLIADVCMRYKIGYILSSPFQVTWNHTSFFSWVPYCFVFYVVFRKLLPVTISRSLDMFSLFSIYEFENISWSFSFKRNINKCSYEALFLVEKNKALELSL